MSRHTLPTFSTGNFRRLLPLGLSLTLFLIATVVGCVESPTVNEDAKKFKKAAPDPLKILVIGETSIGPKLQRQWKSRMDGELTVENILESEWIDSNFSIDSSIDLVVYPTTFIGELTESGKILKLDNSIWGSDEIDKGSYLDHYGRTIVRHGNQPMAVPLGNPHFSMLFDRTQFNKLGVADAAPVGLPATWSALEDSIEKLKGKVELPLAKGWAGHTLICRVAPNARAVGSFSVLFDRATMAPQIAERPFVEAIESLKRIATESSLNATPDQTFRSVIDGQALAALGWPAKTDENNSNDGNRKDEQRGSLAVTTVPGTNQVYDFRRDEWKNLASNDQQHVDLIGISGLVISMVSNNQHEYSAGEFLKWVSNKKIILSVMTDSPKTGPVRASHLGNIGKWTGDSVSLDLADEYAAVIREIHQRNLVVLFPRIPGGHRYYDALDAGVRSALSGQQSSQEALDSVAAQWVEITESIGRKEQIQAMRHDSGF